MINNKTIEAEYQNAKAQYAALGVDTEKVLSDIDNINISLHCWQADDVGGFEKPDSGTIHFKGHNISNKSVIQRARLGMGRLFQTPRIFSEVTVLDNLMAASNYTTGHNLIKYLFKKRGARKRRKDGPKQHITTCS